MKPFVFPPTFAELLLKSNRPQAHGRPTHSFGMDIARCKKPARGLFNDSFDANAKSSQATTQVAMSIYKLLRSFVLDIFIDNEYSDACTKTKEAWNMCQQICND
jgi:hypothetical protein